MKKLYRILTLIIGIGVSGVLSGAELPFQKIREEAARLKRNSPEDYELGKKLAAEMKKMAATRQKVNATPQLIMETITWKSGVMYNTNNYYWYDRPLFIDRSLWRPGNQMTLPSFLHTYKIMQDSFLDGCNFFLESNTPTKDRPYLAAEEGKWDTNFRIFPTVCPVDEWYKLPAPELLKRVNKSPYMTRIDGKPVYLSYAGDRIKAPALKKFIEKLETAAGEKVFFVTAMDGYSGNRWPSVHYQKKKGVPATLLLGVFDYVTEYLRISGGVKFGSLLYAQDLSFMDELCEQYMLPLFGAACAQPEFKGQKKILCFSLLCGYTSYHGDQRLSCDGTRTFRKRMELAEKFGVDIIHGFEWEELNENTNLEPTVSKPMAYQRLFRYYKNRFKGNAPSANPGDDLSLPNLIVSHRRQLHCGWDFELELLQVPDGSKGTYKVRAELYDQTGKVVYRSKEYTFDQTKLADKMITLRTENYANSRFLQPRLILKTSAGTRVIDGLPPTVLRGTVTNDHTWYSTPLRNLINPKKAAVSFKEGKTIVPGVRRVNVDADVQTAESINAAEVMQNSNQIYALDAQDEFLQNNPDYCFYRFSARNYNKPLTVPIKATFSAGNALFFPPFNSSMLHTHTERAATKIQGGTHKFNVGAGEWSHDIYFAVKRSDIPKTTFRISGVRTGGPWKDKTFSWDLPLSALGEYGVRSTVFPDGLNFVMATQYRPMRLPLDLNTKTIQFKSDVVADHPSGVLALRLVSNDGKIWWSRAYAPAVKGKKQSVATYSDRRGKVAFQLAENRIPKLSYRPDSTDNNIIATAAGREFYAHAGGYASLAAAFAGISRDRYGIPQVYHSIPKNQISPPAPEVKKLENGVPYWQFIGSGRQFIAFPNSVIPQRSGFTITLDLSVDNPKKNQIFLAQYGSWSVTGFQFGINNGALYAKFNRRRPAEKNSPFHEFATFQSKIQLKADERQKITFRYDEERIEISANGQTQSMPCTGVGIWMSPSAFGGWGKEGFEGKLFGITIDHAVSPISK